MEEESWLNKFNKIPFGLKVIGLFNIIFALILMYIFFFIFVLLGVLCYMARNEYSNFQSLLLSIIVYRLILIIFYSSTFILFFSGIDIFTGNSRAKKMILIAAPIIIFCFTFIRFLFIDNIPRLFWVSYLIISLVYIFCNRNAVKFFSSKGTKLNLAIPLGIMFLIYLLGFWFGKSVYS